jgi:cytoskeletal protein CcmA (bactofilin family)
MWWEKKGKPPVEEEMQRPIMPPPPPLPEREETMTESTKRDGGSPATRSGETFIGRTLVLKGELSAEEDLQVEGQFEGNIQLPEHCLTVGANGHVKAEIRARHVIIVGSVEGNITANEKVEIRKTGHVVGDIVAAAIAVDEGAYFKGSIDILRDGAAGGSPSHTTESPSMSNA